MYYNQNIVSNLMANESKNIKLVFDRYSNVEGRTDDLEMIICSNPNWPPVWWYFKTLEIHAKV